MSSGLFSSLGISASGMTATRLQMDVVSENLANADSTSTAEGGPYQRKEVVLQQQNPSFADALTSASGGIGPMGAQTGQGVEVAGIVNDQTPGQKVYDPGHPDADAQGYVTMPNVNPVTEMTDLISASRSYEANVQALNATKTMFTRTLDLLK